MKGQQKPLSKSWPSNGKEEGSKADAVLSEIFTIPNDGKALMNRSSPHTEMQEEQFIKSSDKYRVQRNASSESDPALEELIHGRTRILNTKLEVLAMEIHERLKIRASNFDHIEEDKTLNAQMLASLNRSANYLMRQHKEKAPFYEQIFKLEQERRMQNVECWRDVVLVMRDFLFAWEAHELAKNKAMFLDHV